MACKKKETVTSNPAWSIDVTTTSQVKAANKFAYILPLPAYNNVSSVKETGITKNELIVNTKALAIGKRKITVDDSLLGPDLESRKSGLDIATLGSGDSDLFRFAIGKYWVIDGKSFYYLDAADASYTILDFDFTREEAKKIKDIYVESERQKDLDQLVNNILIRDNVKSNSFFGTKQWVLIQSIKNKFLVMKSSRVNLAVPLGGNSVFNLVAVPKNNPGMSALKGTQLSTVQNQLKGSVESLQYDEELWKTFILGGKTNLNNKDMIFSPLLREGYEFIDQAFEIQIPFSKRELESFSGVNSPAYANITMEYNFLVEAYESQIKAIPEVLIPNMYILLSELNTKVEKKTFNDIVTIQNAINKNNIVQNVGRFADVKNKDLMQHYFRDFADALVDLKRGSRRYVREYIDNLGLKFKNIGIPITNITILSDYESKKYMFPMYSEIEFSTDKTTIFSDILKDSKFSTTLMSQIIYDNSESTPGNPGSYETKTFVEAAELIQQVRARYNPNKTVTSKSFSYERKERKIWDITKWINVLSNPTSQNKEEKNVLSDISNLSFAEFLDKETTEKPLNNSSYSFFVQLMKIIFVGKLRKLIKDKFRTYEEMLSGKLAYSETVLYRIEKRLSDNNGNPIGDVIQNFYLPNANDYEVLKFIDTQLKYGVRYVYTIYAYQAVIGTKYHYSDIKISGEYALFSVVQSPIVSLIETPFFTFNGMVMDDPPVSPDVNIIPYKGYNSEMLFFFNGGIGDYMLDPIIIEPGDKEKIDTLRKAKDYAENEKIRFKSDDHSGFFQVFRTDIWPRSYSDFTGKLIAAVETDVSKLSFQKASNAAYIDYINPNKWYYYCFRTIDFHGHISNPSELFRIKLVDERGTVFPIIEECDFNRQIEKINYKPMRKYLFIKPKLSQTVVNEQKSGIENLESVKDVRDIQLGLMDETVFGKDYLIRLTSKQSGKTIEFKIRLNHSFVKKDIT